MRQAGRYLPEYRELRKKYGILEIQRSPELSAKVTMMPIKRFDFDAAIVYADIISPLESAGISFKLEENIGPVTDSPIRCAADVERLRVAGIDEVAPNVAATIMLALKELNGKVPLIGFAGAPFTLATYLIEGRPDRSHLKTKRLMYQDPGTWHALMEKLSGIVINYLTAQIRAGVHAFQLFDSWVGSLSPSDYEEYVLPYSEKVFSSLARFDVPSIHFGTETAAILHLMRTAGSSVLGVDWRINLDDARRIIGEECTIQGNLDPMVLLGPHDVIESRTRDILRRAGGKAGHIFSLGHGVLPETPLDAVEKVIDTVHSYRRA